MVADRCRDEIVVIMKDQFTLFSNRISANEAELSHISSRVSLLESLPQSETNIEIHKESIPVDQKVIPSEMDHKVLRSGRRVWNTDNI